MIRKLFAALLAFVASAALAAVDINKATQADLESIKGIGEGNASKFSADGLTVNDKAYRPAAASTTKDANVTAKVEADAKPDKKAETKADAKTEKKTTAPSAPAPTKAAASAPATKK